MHVIEYLKLWQQMCVIPPIYCRSFRSSITNLRCCFFGTHICRLKLRDFLSKHTSIAYNLEKKLSRHTSMASKLGEEFQAISGDLCGIDNKDVPKSLHEQSLHRVKNLFWGILGVESGGSSMENYIHVAQEIFDMIKTYLLCLAMFLIL